MRRIIRSTTWLLVVVVVLMMSGCSQDTRNYKSDYDGDVIEYSKILLESWPEFADRVYEVKYKDGIYEANINGNIQMIQIQGDEPEIISHSWEEEVSNKDILEIFKNAKELVIDYIQKSRILVQKDMLIREVVDIPIKYTDADLTAEYKSSTIFVNPKHSDDICEWMIVHELVHYLCELTNGGIYREEYPYEMFNEVMTDIITLSMGPNLPENAESGYAMYYDFIFAYIGCFKEEAIKAYFYGYDWIFEVVGKDEFDLFVKSFDQLDSSEVALIIINNSINKWKVYYC